MASNGIPQSGEVTAEKLRDVSEGVLFLVMLIFCGGTFFLTNISKMPLPYTVILFLYGIFVGFIAHWLTPDVAAALCNIPPELLFYIFLPVLIFEGSYAMNVHALRSVFPQVLILASVGVFLNTGLLVFPIRLFFSDFSWYAALLLGSLLSATDPVAVVSLLKDLGVDNRITAMVDGEAIMNDGAAIIAFQLLLFPAHTGYMKDSTWIILWKGIRLAGLPIIVGLFFGFLERYWLRRARNGLVKACITVSLTYVSYFIAGNIIGTSGVLTLFFCGTFLSFNCPSIFPGRYENLMYNIWEFLVHLGNTILFSLVGVILVDDVIPTLKLYDLFIIAGMYIVMIVARVLMLEILLPILNLFPYRLSQRDVLLLSHAGLRGGVAVTLALAVLQADVNDGVSILKVTCGVVLLTLFINATTAETVVELLGHKRKEQHRMVQMEYALKHLRIISLEKLQESKNNDLYRSANWFEAEAYVNDRLRSPYENMSILKEDTGTIVNRLLMRAFRTSLWRQRDDGLISETVVLVISRAIANAIDTGRLIEVKDLKARELPAYKEITEELEILLFEENFVPLWVSVSEVVLGKGYWVWAHGRIHQNAFMALLSFARCLADVGSMKYQYIKDQTQERQVEAWIMSQKEEVDRIIRLFHAKYPYATMCVCTSRAVLRFVDEGLREVKRLHDHCGFGLKPTAALVKMLHNMREDVPYSWGLPKLDNELAVAALAATPLGRGLSPEEINTVCAMGTMRELHEGDEIQPDDGSFFVIVFGSVKPKRGRWVAFDEGHCGFGCIIGLETCVIPAQLRDDNMNRWVVTTTECRLLSISYRRIKPFLWENSLVSVRAFWRAVAVATLLHTLEDMITLPTTLQQISRDHLTVIIMGGTPLIGLKECNEMDWSPQFHLYFYLRGSDTTRLFRDGHTAPCYISALFARRLKWEDPQVVLYAIPVNVGDSGYVPWFCNAAESVSGDMLSTGFHSREMESLSAMNVVVPFCQEVSSTYAETANIFNSILRGHMPGETGLSIYESGEALVDNESFDGVDACVLQNPTYFVTNVPYVNQLFMRYATVLEGLCIAALRYVSVPSDNLNIRHAQQISEQALSFMMIFCNEVTLLFTALRRVLCRELAGEAIPFDKKEEENELNDMRMICNVLTWDRMAKAHKTFPLRKMVLQLKSLANRRFCYLRDSLNALAETHPELKEADSVEELQRILLGIDFCK